MLTCNLIYWTIVVPIVSFGSEIWCLSEADYDNLGRFQIHIGKRIQRFPSRAPNSCSSFRLGWMRFVTYILIKKLLFALTILRLNEESIIRKVFVERTKNIEKERHLLAENVHNSPSFEIYNAAIRMGLFNILCDMTCGRKPLCTKKSWSKYVWEKAWKLEDLFWASTSIIQDNDLLVKVMEKTKYLI